MHGALVFFPVFVPSVPFPLLSFHPCLPLTPVQQWGMACFFFIRFHHQWPNLSSFRFWEVTDGTDEGRYMRRRWFCMFWVAFERLGGCGWVCDWSWRLMTDRTDGYMILNKSCDLIFYFLLFYSNLFIIFKISDKTSVISKLLCTLSKVLWSSGYIVCLCD